MIRLAEARDYGAMASIYRWYIEHSSACLAWQAENDEAFAERMESLKKRYPVLVSEWEGEIIGFGYADAWLSKEAYQYCAELTVYFRQGSHHGEPARLGKALERLLALQNVRWLISCTTASNQPSLSFQKKHGFAPWGLMEQAGWKDGQWHDVEWLAKEIGSGWSAAEMRETHRHWISFAQIDPARLPDLNEENASVQQGS